MGKEVEAVTSYLKVLSSHVLGRTKENHTMPSRTANLWDEIWIQDIKSKKQDIWYI
jgi:hypothetical protein